MSISKKLHAILIGLLVLLSFGLGGISYYQSYKAVRYQIETNIPQMVSFGADWVASVIESKLELVETIANDPYIRSMEWDVQKEILEQETARLGFLGMGIIYPDGHARYPDGSSAELGDRDYFRTAMSGRDAFSDVIISRVTNSAVMIFAAPIRQDDGTVQAVLLARLDAVWLSEITDRIGYGERGYSYIIDKEGTLIAHDNRDFVLEQTNFIREAETQSEYARLASMFKRMIQGETGMDEYPFFGSVRFFGYTPIPDSSWSIAVGGYKDDVFAQIYQLRFSIILFSLLFILVGMIPVILLSRNIVRPIRKTLVMLQDISEGEGDLTKRLEVSSKDETGLMTRYFNHTLEKVQNLVSAVKQQAGLLSNIGLDLASNMEETAAAVQQINANISSIKNQAQNQSASVLETTRTMEQITSNIEMLDYLIAQQAAGVEQSSSAIEQMIASIASVTKTLQSNTENVHDLSIASEEGRSDLNEVSINVRDIAKESEGLLEIAQLIQDIAGQTDLLSMNAAIEAAHAGDAGRGFAVVADEIRKLAESSGTQARTVSSILTKIKEAMDGINTDTDRVLAKFEEVDEKIKIIAQKELSIKNAMDEQSNGSREILEAISQLNDITFKVRNSSTEMMTGSKEILEESSNLGTISEEISGAMNEMASGMSQINVAVNSVNGLSRDNKESIKVLTGELEKFRIDESDDR